VKQIQRQTVHQGVILSQHMRSSLSLLQMGSGDVALALEEECRRNPFIKYPIPVGVGTSGSSKLENHGIQEFDVERSDIDALVEQVSLIRMLPNERALADELVHCLDERGFFTESPQEISEYTYALPSLIVSVVAKLQTTVEPTGVFAWSLQDCFKIQLEEKGLYNTQMAAILNHLNLVATQDVASICKIINVDHKTAEAMISDIRSLRPSPFSRQPAFQNLHQAADIIFQMSSGGEITVELNESALPKLLTDDALFSTIKTTEVDETSLAYYRDCYRTAAAHVIAMQKRANTLLRIGNEIVRVQDRFIRTERPLDLKPLTMSGISKNLGVNKSTVSRALNECLIETSNGLISAHKFFVRPLTDSTSLKTREQAFSRLSLLIKTEDSKCPFSDEMLAQQLSAMNLTISRRTVAKYRGILGIPNTFERRSS
jgi:RNA polymerase sigma-54 factor